LGLANEYSKNTLQGLLIKKEGDILTPRVSVVTYFKSWHLIPRLINDLD